MNAAILSFDLEDWFQLTSARFGISAGRAAQGRLRVQVSRILELLSRYDAHATFFVLGKTAAACPDVVKEVAARGHEIASHGYGHELVRSLTPKAFREDLERSLDVLRNLAQAPIRGYRAPEFSIDQRSFWAFDVLLDLGFTYDSSVFPIRGPRYGIPDAPLVPYRLRAPSGREIVELPLAVLERFGKRVPIAGGGYWRVLPRAALDWAVADVAQSRAPMLYFHPAEFDERPLNLSFRNGAIAKFVLAQNLFRTSITSKLEALLRKRRCVSASEYLHAEPPILSTPLVAA